MAKGYEEGVVIKGHLDRKTYLIKEFIIGAAVLVEKETGIETKVGISALELFFQPTD